MPVVSDGDTARLEGSCTVYECEDLMSWLGDNPTGKVDLSACEHLHVAVLQALMTCSDRVSAMPQDEGLSAWVTAALEARDPGEES